MAEKTVRTDPKLWEECKIEALAMMNGVFSARAMQYAVQLYKKRGGGYVNAKDPGNSLNKWQRRQSGDGNPKEP